MSSKIGQEPIVLVLGLFFGVKALADPHYDKRDSLVVLF